MTIDPPFKRTMIGVALLALHVATAQAAEGSSLRITSSSFADGGAIPVKFTCDGADVSPDLQFSSPPAATRSFAIVTDDPDAPVTFTHWLAYGIPAATRQEPEGASSPSQRLAQGGEGINGFGHAGYGGPCPPQGQQHHYVFHVYALDVVPSLPPGANTQQVKAAMQGHVLAEGSITGLYARGGG